MSQFDWDWEISQDMERLVLKLGKSPANQDEFTLVKQWKERGTREEVENRKKVKRRAECLSMVYATSLTMSGNVGCAAVGSS